MSSKFAHDCCLCGVSVSWLGRTSTAVVKRGGMRKVRGRRREERRQVHIGSRIVVQRQGQSSSREKSPPSISSIVFCDLPRSTVQQQYRRAYKKHRCSYFEQGDSKKLQLCTGCFLTDLYRKLIQRLSDVLDLDSAPTAKHFPGQISHPKQI